MGEPSKRFEFTEHTADVGIQVFGRNLKELFENAALGLINMMADPETIELKRIVDIRVESEDLKSMMVEWLNEIIYAVESQGLIFGRIIITELTGNKIAATLAGEPPNSDKHTIKTDIKACTYHEVRVEKSEAGWSAEVLLDI